MQIVLKHNPSHWVEIGDGIKVLVDYPTIEQKDKLDELLYELTFNAGDDVTAENLDKKLSRIAPNRKAKMISLNQMYQKLYLKYVIKDWKGIKDEKGKAVKCIIEDNELENSLWTDLCRELRMEDLTKLYQLLLNELEFTDVDKKK